MLNSTIVTRLCWSSGVLLAAALLSPSTVCAEEPSTIRSDEHVVFFPTAASLSKDGRTWAIPIHGWIFEPEADSSVRNELVNRLRNELSLVLDQESVLRFDTRLRLFLRDNERGKNIGIRLAGRTFVLPDSAEDGHFTTELKLPVDVAEAEAKNGWLTFQAVVPKHDERVFAGRVQLVPRTGITVLSDIDDTVKVSQVTDKGELIANTLVRPFRAAPGMPALYREWQKLGAVFCFVSSSPWQLYEPLSAWMKRDNFPEAAFLLKQVRFRDPRSVLTLFDNPFDSKVSGIEAIMKRFPQRRFALVGDSGEKDPEVYGEIARRHSHRIVAILIRNVTDTDADDRRWSRAFRGVEPGLWKLFVHPDELGEIDLARAAARNQKHGR